MTAQHLAALTSPVSYKPKVYLTQGGLLIVSRLFSSSTPPPIKSTIITTTLSLNPAFLFLHPPHLPTSYLRELGENQSFVRAYMLLQPALLPSQGISLLSLGWKGRMGGGISYEETRNAKWRRLELWWPLSSSDKLTATPWGTFFPSPFYICPIHSCNIPSTTTTTLFCHSARREAIIIIVAAASRRSWKPKVICPSIFCSVLVVFQCCWLSSLDHSCPRENLAITMKDEVEVYTPVLWEYFVITEL